MAFLYNYSLHASRPPPDCSPQPAFAIYRPSRAEYIFASHQKACPHTGEAPSASSDDGTAGIYIRLRALSLPRLHAATHRLRLPAAPASPMTISPRAGWSCLLLWRRPRYTFQRPPRVFLAMTPRFDRGRARRRQEHDGRHANAQPRWSLKARNDDARMPPRATGLDAKRSLDAAPPSRMRRLKRPNYDFDARFTVNAVPPRRVLGRAFTALFSMPPFSSAAGRCRQELHFEKSITPAFRLSMQACAGQRALYLPADVMRSAMAFCRLPALCCS